MHAGNKEGWTVNASMMSTDHLEFLLGAQGAGNSKSLCGNGSGKTNEKPSQRT
jgi:hypothetical protein